MQITKALLARPTWPNSTWMLISEPSQGRNLPGGLAGPLLGAVLIAAGLGLGLPLVPCLLPARTMRARRGLPTTILARGVLTSAFFGADAYVTLTITTIRHHGPGPGRPGRDRVHAGLDGRGLGPGPG
jgi:hypothetical protein